uniref:ATP synthase F0 subunit 8 n=1 Tax=Eudarcia gwangneungensis TaxID=2716286 RepID=A0A6G7MZ69_9NEOP|nr:ATP synthase F0 subunit 8 [Eudarcia gwangneungensis]QIJ46444.1 ATP synthase F0 subunit 8 [Eudarcia gwangneungensis]
MPQMMPINWILLLMFFISCFILFNIVNYYIFYKKINFFNKKIFKFKIFFWKW